MYKNTWMYEKKIERIIVFIDSVLRFTLLLQTHFLLQNLF